MSSAIAPRLGELLLEKRLITASQLNEAIALQQREKKSLGEILKARSLISERQLQRTLRWQQWLRASAAISALSLATVPQAMCSDYEQKKTARQYQTSLERPAFEPYQFADSLSYDEDSGRSGPSASASYDNQSNALKDQAKDLLGAPAYTLLRGKYTGGALENEEGWRYQLKWSTHSAKVQFTYSF